MVSQLACQQLQQFKRSKNEGRRKPHYLRLLYITHRQSPSKHSCTCFWHFEQQQRYPFRHQDLCNSMPQFGCRPWTIISMIFSISKEDSSAMNSTSFLFAHHLLWLPLSRRRLHVVRRWQWYVLRICAIPLDPVRRPEDRHDEKILLESYWLRKLWCRLHFGTPWPILKPRMSVRKSYLTLF